MTGFELGEDAKLRHRLFLHEMYRRSRFLTASSQDIGTVQLWITLELQDIPPKLCHNQDKGLKLHQSLDALYSDTVAQQMPVIGCPEVSLLTWDR